MAASLSVLSIYLTGIDRNTTLPDLGCGKAEDLGGITSEHVKKPVIQVYFVF